MPTYEYSCDSCGHNFEEFQSISASPLTICPKCQGKVRRLIGGGNGFLFKGNGFYITDYRSDTYKKDRQNSESAASESKSENSSSSKSTETSTTSLTQNSAKTSEK